MDETKPKPQEKYILDKIEVLQNWHHEPISKDVLLGLEVGNHVRISVKGYFSLYVRILDLKTDGQILGMFDDPYNLRGNFAYPKTGSYSLPMKDGDLITFTRENIYEIPFGWLGNENLDKYDLNVEKEQSVHLKNQNELTEEQAVCVENQHKQMHNNSCNICKIWPIMGIRYVCLGCIDFDICEKCMPTLKGHETHKITLCTRGDVEGEYQAEYLNVKKAKLENELKSLGISETSERKLELSFKDMDEYDAYMEDEKNKDILANKSFKIRIGNTIMSSEPPDFDFGPDSGSDLESEPESESELESEIDKVKYN